jgi:hypothetical protein
MKRTNIEPQLIPFKDLIKIWNNFKEFIEQFKNK